jgi:hypothetical protein
VGIGYTPPLWDPTVVDDVVAVKTDDAKDMARRLAREAFGQILVATFFKAQWQTVVTLAAIVIILAVKPSGIFGKYKELEESVRNLLKLNEKLAVENEKLKAHLPDLPQGTGKSLKFNIGTFNLNNLKVEAAVWTTHNLADHDIIGSIKFSTTVWTGNLGHTFHLQISLIRISQDLQPIF